jgi:hypothetical protein
MRTLREWRADVYAEGHGEMTPDEGEEGVEIISLEMKKIGNSRGYDLFACLLAMKYHRAPKIKEYLSAIGAAGGSVKSEAKAKAARVNGRKHAKSAQSGENK